MNEKDKIKLAIYESSLSDITKYKLTDILNIYESSKDKVYRYEKIKTNDEIKKFNSAMKKVFNSDSGMNNSEIRKDMYHIIYENNVIGYIGFSKYKIDGKKYLGIGNFMFLPEYQRNGHGTKVINDIININKSKYDEIYCYVDKKNTGAIKFYKKIANVNKEPNENGMYYVTLWKK